LFPWTLLSLFLPFSFREFSFHSFNSFHLSTAKKCNYTSEFNRGFVEIHSSKSMTFFIVLCERRLNRFRIRFLPIPLPPIPFFFFSQSSVHCSVQRSVSTDIILPFVLKGSCEFYREDTWQWPWKSPNLQSSRRKE
jgi:hypothetical protein